MAAVATDGIHVEGQPVELVDSVTNAQIPAVLHPRGNSLAAALANAGGKLAFRDPRGRLGSWPEGETVAVSNASGAAVCTIRFGVELESGAVLSLPDGSEAVVLSAGKSFSLKGADGPGGKNFILSGRTSSLGLCKGQLSSDIILKEGAECVVRLESPCRPWVLPFMLCTACLGACCVNCMACEPTYLVKLSGTTCGEVHRAPDSCGGCCKSPLIVLAEDPTALHGALLCITLHYYWGHFWDR